MSSKILFDEGLESLIPNKPIIFYLHYSPTDLLTNREIEVLTALQESGFQICLIINTERQNHNQIDSFAKKYTKIYDALIIRNNIGHDLAGYRDSYFQLREKNNFQFETVFFMNNSLIWFPKLVGSYFSKLLDQPVDIICSSISNQHSKHIQTFLFGSLTELGFEEFANWFRKIRNSRFKLTHIIFGEMKTRVFFKSDLSIRSYPDMVTLMARSFGKLIGVSETESHKLPKEIQNRIKNNRNFAFAGIAQNPMHSNWLEMLEEGFPGVKIDLIKRNPTGITDYDYLIRKLFENEVSLEEISSLLLSNKPSSGLVKVRNRLKI